MSKEIWIKKENHEIVEKQPPNHWDHITIALAEFLGTATLLFLTCLGSCFGMQGDVSSMHTSFNAGLAVTAVIQAFGHLSGAHINPAVSLGALIVNKIDLVSFPTYIISQLLGAITGSALFAAVTNSEYTGILDNGSGVCVNTISENITLIQGLFVEVLLSIILNFANCSSWDARNSDKLDSVSIKIGLLVVIANLAGGPYTGASMNPARSFGPAVLSGDYKNHWVYWIGPTLGSVFAAVFYRVVFLRNKPE